MITLAVVLRSGNRIRAGHRFNVTSGMPDGVWGAWRRLAANRETGEHVQVTVTADGMPYGQWNADHTWPRASADAIQRARQQEVTA